MTLRENISLEIQKATGIKAFSDEAADRAIREMFKWMSKERMRYREGQTREGNFSSISGFLRHLRREAGK